MGISEESDIAQGTADLLLPNGNVARNGLALMEHLNS